jgi:helicase required for RNAi-mediated heterochromatin assembly 1
MGDRLTQGETGELRCHFGKHLALWKAPSVTNKSSPTIVCLHQYLFLALVSTFLNSPSLYPSFLFNLIMANSKDIIVDSNGYVRFFTNRDKPKAIEEPKSDDAQPIRPASAQEDIHSFTDLHVDEVTLLNLNDDAISDSTLKVACHKTVTKSKYDRRLEDIFGRLHDYFFWEPSNVTKPSWRTRPEIPSSREVMGAEEVWQETDEEGIVMMDPNICIGQYPDRESYLKTHYEFLREEGVGPLRDAVKFARANIGAHETTTQGYGLYDPVRITGVTCSKRGIAVEVTFSTQRVGVRIDWEQTSRLMTGCLVALSRDNFQSSCIVAIVAAHDIEKLKQNPPKIDLYISDADYLEIDPTMTFVMVENRNSFYEAQKHTMLALHRMAEEPFPFSAAIVRRNRKFNDNPPEHITNDPFFDFSKFYGSEFKSVNILDPFPSNFYEDGETMDKSQCDALRLILTKPLAIVQGPPGTGKTFVSIVALKLLLSKMQDDDPPIIVATQTNHALDQLLRHIALDVQDCFARLGGRSKDDGIVKMRTIFELRGKLERGKKPSDPNGNRKQANHNLRSRYRDLTKYLEFFDNEEPQIDEFVRANIISREQADSIIKGDDGWIGAASVETTNSLLRWLGRQAKTNHLSYPLQDFGLIEMETVLEQEQIDERTAEILQDDYIDKVYGDYISIKQGWIGVGEKMGCGEADVWLKEKNLNKIPAGIRGKLYNYMLDQLKKDIREKVRSTARVYTKSAKRFELGGFERDVGILSKQKVIGMTTTGLSKNRTLIQALNPKILLIEEAAEILEAPVIAGCMPSIQHIILVGDHKQLKPQCQIKDNEGEPFYFDLSLFERLVNNKFEYRMLTRQRRMIPEVRRLLKPIYNDAITDHECVLNRKDVPGMGGVNTYMWKHDWVESKDNYNSMENFHEASMIVGFCFYLLHNGVKRQHITILTFYNAQRRLISKLIAEESKNHVEFFQYDADDKSIGFKIVTVDSYQGEENDIILLSLVRSNNSDTIGFSGVDNRVCVALSRAIRGLYIFGNVDMFARKSSTWEIVKKIMSDDLIPRTGTSMTITCEKHKNATTITDPKDWEELNGGCKAKCDQKLICGHPCPLKCHS